MDFLMQIEQIYFSSYTINFQHKKKSPEDLTWDTLLTKIWKS